MKRIKLYAVEYYLGDKTTFDIFKTFEEAKKFEKKWMI